MIVPVLPEQVEQHAAPPLVAAAGAAKARAGVTLTTTGLARTLMMRLAKRMIEVERMLNLKLAGGWFEDA
jgi:hypothetical protein